MYKLSIESTQGDTIEIKHSNPVALVHSASTFLAASPELVVATMSLTQLTVGKFPIEVFEKTRMTGYPIKSWDSVVNSFLEAMIIHPDFEPLRNSPEYSACMKNISILVDHPARVIKIGELRYMALNYALRNRLITPEQYTSLTTPILQEPVGPTEQ